MDLQVTKTFQKTYDAFYALENEKEISEAKNFEVEPIYKYRNIVSMGGSRSSKSYSILQLLLIYMMTNKRKKITVWRDQKVVCRSTVLEDFQNIILFDYNVFGNIEHNKQQGSFVYVPTGSKIIFEGADNYSKVLGGTQDISFFNEVSEFSERVYLEIAQRTSDRIFFDYNPSKSFWLEKLRNDPRTCWIHSTFEDNAFCPPNIIQHIRGYDPWEEGSYEVINSEVYHNGQPISPHNQPPRNKKNVKAGTANEFMWKVYGLGIQAEKPNKIYRGWGEISEEEFEKLSYQSYYGLDFGVNSPTACIEVKYDGDVTLYIRKRIYKPLQDIEDSIATTLYLEVNEIKETDLLIVDSAKKNLKMTLQSAGYNAVGSIKGNGSVELGIGTVQKFNIKYVHSDELIHEYNNYSWEVDRYGKSTDKPFKQDDHLLDALRYVASYLVRYLQIKL